MEITLYESPLRIELRNNTLFVNGKQHPRAVRKTNDLLKTLATEDAGGNLDIYYMFRNICTCDDIRFDITVIPAGEIGTEFPKTFGHHHPKSTSGVDYPEVYQVLHGKAFFILQKKNQNKSVDVVLIDAKEKDILIIPPGYGHVSINNGTEDLVLSNLVYDKFSSIYDSHNENKGAAYYYLRDGEIKQNTNYIVHKNEHITAREWTKRYEFSCNDLLVEFYENPKKFAFLVKPEILF
ncbi:glucose-6-phosphate isomerase [Candidatus Micrarchaeota archaeon]|nr:glucose-6-phosphate isomerase [Candidatus Micrarchaeota archaeon]